MHTGEGAGGVERGTHGAKSLSSVAERLVQNAQFRLERVQDAGKERGWREDRLIYTKIHATSTYLLWIVVATMVVVIL